MMTIGATNTQVSRNFASNSDSQLNMVNNSLEKIIYELRIHETQVKSQLRVLTGQASEFSEKLSEVQTAITALTSNVPT